MKMALNETEPEYSNIMIQELLGSRNLPTKPTMNPERRNKRLSNFKPNE